MSKSLQWITGIGLVVITLAVVFSVIAPFLMPRLGWAGYPMMGGSGHMFGGSGMMNWGMPFFGIGMVVGPLVLIGLIGLGVVGLLRTLGPGQAQPPAAAGPACAHCGKPLQANWKACPYCGEKVE